MDLVQLATFMYPHEAHLAMGKLDAHGIESSLQDELTIQINNFYSNAIGGVKLHVLAEDLDRAKEVLALDYSAEQDEDADQIKETASETNAFQCPNCNSWNVGEPRLKGPFALLSTLLLGFPFPLVSKQSWCFDCHTAFKIR
jgi:hypothetical protein